MTETKKWKKWYPSVTNRPLSGIVKEDTPQISTSSPKFNIDFNVSSRCNYEEFKRNPLKYTQ